MTDCVLHIGLEKTGTTSIQAALAANRERLLTKGILYPRSLGHKSHVRAYAYASEGPLDEIKTHCGLDTLASLEDFRSALSIQLDEEIATAQPTKIIVSNEHLSSRLLSTSEISRLRSLLSSHCRSIRVVVYLRAQGDALQSDYSTYIKTGGTDPFQLPGPALLRDRYRYDTVLRRWEAVFGPGSMDVRLYEPGEFPDGDIVSDFADVFDGLISVADLAREPQRNLSLDSFTLSFLKAINRYVPYKSGVQMNEMRGNLHDLVETFASGSPFTGDVAVVDALNAAVEESNEAVRQKYFPSRPAPLFRPSARSATIAPAEPAIPEEAVRLMACLWEAKQAQVLDLRKRLEQRTAAANGRKSPVR